MLLYFYWRAKRNLNRTPMFEFRFFCFLLRFVVLRIRVFKQGFCPVFSIVNHLLMCVKISFYPSVPIVKKKALCLYRIIKTKNEFDSKCQKALDKIALNGYNECRKSHPMTVSPFVRIRN